MDSTELLEQLADIHLPAAVTYWPPAPGWWLLAALLLAIVTWAVQTVVRQIKQRKICAYALGELDKIHLEYNDDNRESEDAARLMFVNRFNAVIRRVALWHYPNSGIASLGGVAWVDFIQEKGDSSGMTEEISEAISQGRFKPRCDVDINQLYRFGQQWISSLYMNYSKAGDSLKLST
jgi:hypothetical protein